jgi:hypothetical protein
MKELKKKILDILSREDISGSLHDLDEFPPKKILGPLFSGLLNSDEITRWHAITAMGHVVNNLAGKDMEQGRIVMRRLMWSLNDESGGIGWGAPECMAEIMARHSGLADEFHCILFSYLVEREDGADNYLEYEPLRRGAFWGLARFAQSRSSLARKALENALKGLKNEDDPFILACLCKYFQLIEYVSAELRTKITKVQDQPIELYWNQKLIHTLIKDICPLT